MTPLVPRLPRAISVALLGLLLAFNAVTAALNPALPGVGEAAVAKLTTYAPLAAQFREPTSVVKLTANRAGGRDDEHGGPDPALPPLAWQLVAPVSHADQASGVPSVASPGAAPQPYRARAPPFAA